MKRVLIFALILALVVVLFASVCSAESVVDMGTTEISLSDKEQAVRDIIDTLLNEGNEVFADQPWWDTMVDWVNEHMGDIVAGLGGLITLAGALLVLLRTNPKLKAWITSFGKSCKGWFEGIKEGIENLKSQFERVDADSSKLVNKIERLEKCTMALVTAFEDVIKLSGADEGKKEIYIKQIEQAKAAVKDEK